MDFIFANSRSWSNLVFFERIFSKRFTVFHDDWIFVGNFKLYASTDYDKKGIGIVTLFENDIAFVKFQGMSVIGKVSLFFTRQIFEKSDFINVGFGKLVVFLDDFLHGLLKYLMLNAKELTMFQSLDRCGSGGCINEGKFSKALSRSHYFDVFFLVVKLDSNSSFSDDKEHCCSFALFENVLVGIGLAQFKILKKIFPLYRGESVKEVMISYEVFGQLHIAVWELDLEFGNVFQIEFLDGDSLIDFSLFFYSVFSAKRLRL